MKYYQETNALYCVHCSDLISLGEQTTAIFKRDALSTDAVENLHMQLIGLQKTAYHDIMKHLLFDEFMQTTLQQNYWDNTKSLIYPS